MQFVSAESFRIAHEGEEQEDDSENTAYSRHHLKLAWLAVFAWISFGGAILSKIEYSDEVARLKSFCDFKQELDNGMGGLDDALSIFGDVGFCTVPVCNYQIVSRTGTNATNSSTTSTNSTTSGDAGASSDDLNWTFLGSCFFCLTCITTIGYGNYVPISNIGRSFTAVYSVLGLLFYSYANFLLAVTLEAKLHKFHQQYFPAPSNTAAPEQDGRCRRFKRGAEHHLSRMALVLAEIGVVLGWLCVMATAYSHAEGWTFFNSFYFAFVTVNTIGYGDFSPRKSRDHLMNYVFIFGGLFLNSVLLSTLTRSKNAALDGEEGVGPGNDLGGDGEGSWWRRSKNGKRSERWKRAKERRITVGEVVDEVEEDAIVAKSLLLKLLKCLLEWAEHNVRLLWLLFGLISYTVIGGAAFRALESEQASLSMSMLSQTMSEVADGSMRDELKGELLLGTTGDAEGSKLLMNDLLSKLSQARNCPGAGDGVDGMDGESPWTFVASTMFAAATYTSVGYGDIAPETDGGKVMVMLYFFPGAWLFSMVSLEIAKGLHKRILRRIRHAARVARRRRERLRSKREEKVVGTVAGGAGGSDSSSDEDHDVEAVEVGLGLDSHDDTDLDLDSHMENARTATKAKKEAKMGPRPKLDRQGSLSQRATTVATQGVLGLSRRVDNSVQATLRSCLSKFQQKHVVALSAFSMTTSFLVLSGVCFSFLEPWKGSEGVWFAFVTASTIGFGDYVPSYTGGIVWVLQSALMIVGVSLWGLFFQIMSSTDPQSLVNARKARNNLRRVRNASGTGELCKKALKEVNSKSSPLHANRGVPRPSRRPVSLDKALQEAPAAERPKTNHRGGWEDLPKAGPDAERGKWESKEYQTTVKRKNERMII
jgi:hypothetical protein